VLYSLLKKLSKNIEGGFVPKKFGFSTPGTNITVDFLFINGGSLTFSTVLEDYS
jgi:hypothetical protein